MIELNIYKKDCIQLIKKLTLDKYKKDRIKSTK